MDTRAWEVEAGFTPFGPARPVKIKATFCTADQPFRRMTRTARPGELREVSEMVCRLVGAPPDGVVELQHNVPQVERQERGLLALPTGEVFRLAPACTASGRVETSRTAVGPLALWSALDDLADAFSPGEVDRFASHSAVREAIRTAARLLIAAHAEGLRPVDRVRFLAHVAKTGTVAGWTADLISAGVDGLVDALGRALETATVREVGRMVAAILGDGLQPALQRAIATEQGSRAGAGVERAA